MSAIHGLNESVVRQVSEALESFPEVDRAILFGSRAKGVHKPGSDIDLALIGPVLNWRIVGRIYDLLDDLLLPYRFSLIQFDSNIDSDVAAHIARVGVPLFERQHPSPSHSNQAIAVP